MKRKVDNLFKPSVQVKRLLTEIKFFLELVWVQSDQKHDYLRKKFGC